MMSRTSSGEDGASSSALSVGSSSLDSTASTSNSPRLPDLIPSASSHRSSTSTVASTASSNASNRTGWLHTGMSSSPGIVSADELGNAKSAPPSALSNLPAFSRPEPLRAYEPHTLASPPAEVQLTPESETLSEATLQTPLGTASLERLQQAASYANFASANNTVSSDSGDATMDSTMLAAAAVGTANGGISPSSEILAAAAARNSAATQAVLAGYAARRPLDPSIFEHENPPRLSTSSAESSVSSEILTPESGSRIHTWDDVEASDSVADVTRQGTLRARPLTLHRLPSSSKTDTTLRASPPMPNSNNSSAAQSPASQQHNPLEESSAVNSQPRFKVPGAPASRRPSSSKSRSANGSDDCVPTMSKLRLASSPGPESPCDSVESETSSFFAGRDGDSRGRTASTPSSAFRPPIASPDSWRSLLPEHDPFFIPNDGTASVTSASSPRGQGSQLGDAYSASAAAKRESGSSGWGPPGVPADWRRLSSGSQASQQSSFSLPGPVAALGSGRMATSPSWPDRESWRSLLPEGDAGARPPSAGEQLLSASPASPSSPMAEGSRGAFGALDRFGPGGYDYGDPASAAAARRHCSFSTYDRMVRDGVYGSARGGVGNSPASNASSGTTASHNNSTGNLPHGNAHATHSPFIHPPSPNVNDAAVIVGRGAQSFRAPTTNLVEAAKALTTSASAESSGSRPQPITRASGGMKDAEERESWPCSRSLSSFPTTQVGEVADEEQLTRILSDGLRGGLNSQTTLVDTTQGPLGDSALLTQTTTTTVTTTTTTKVTHRGVEGAEDNVSQTSTSPAFGGGGAATAQSTRTLTRSMSQQEPASPYSVSPLSPPTLPFLDHRPAPPETNLTIETSPTRYTLITFLPGFSLDAITLATKHHRQLIIVADKWDEAGGGHFERKVTFSHDANLKKTTASFDGATLKVVIPRIARMHA